MRHQLDCSQDTDTVLLVTYLLQPQLLNTRNCFENAGVRPFKIVALMIRVRVSLKHGQFSYWIFSGLNCRNGHAWLRLGIHNLLLFLTADSSSTASVDGWCRLQCSHAHLPLFTAGSPTRLPTLKQLIFSVEAWNRNVVKLTKLFLHKHHDFTVNLLLKNARWFESFSCHLDILIDRLVYAITIVLDLREHSAIKTHLIAQTGLISNKEWLTFVKCFEGQLQIFWDVEHMVELVWYVLFESHQARFFNLEACLAFACRLCNNIFKIVNVVNNYTLATTVLTPRARVVLIITLSRCHLELFLRIVSLIRSKISCVAPWVTIERGILSLNFSLWQLLVTAFVYIFNAYILMAWAQHTFSIWAHSTNNFVRLWKLSR